MFLQEYVFEHSPDAQRVDSGLPETRPYTLKKTTLVKAFQNLPFYIRR